MKSRITSVLTLGLFGLACFGLACGGPTTTSDELNPISKEEAQSFASADWPFDFCEEFGWYGDGFCDWYCPLPDPDCQCRTSDECAEGDYCNSTFNQPPNPPTFGECLEMGECLTVEDCNHQDNLWFRPMCVGQVTCNEGRCGVDCGVARWCDTTADCNQGYYCAPSIFLENSECLPMGQCNNVMDCYNQDNDWGYPSGWGIGFDCEEGFCEWSIDDNTCAAMGGTCMSDPADVTYPADCEELGMQTVEGTCPAMNHSCCKNVMPPSCEEVGGVCISGQEPPPDSLCSDRGLSPSLEGVCMGYDEICCQPRICAGIIGVLCAEGFECIDVPDSCDPENGGADCSGFCVELDFHECGGFLGLACPQDRACLDIPGDGCDPRNGGADCGGYCVPY